MGFIKFLFSKVFLKQILIAVVVIIALVIGVMQWLKVTTNHGEFKVVPDLSKKSLREAKELIVAEQLEIEVLDSAEYDPKFPRFSILEQNPKSGLQVKEGRKIYVILNPSGYRKISVPKIIEVTKRNAISQLKAVGLDVGEVEYVDDIGKDMVLEIKFEGKTIEPGEMLPKTSRVDLVCGNGNDPDAIIGVDDQEGEETVTPTENNE